MKYLKRNSGIISGILMGLVTIYALTRYFGVPAADLKNFIISTLLFCAAIILLAGLAVAAIRLLGKLFSLLSGREELHGEELHGDELPDEALLGEESSDEKPRGNELRSDGPRGEKPRDESLPHDDPRPGNQGDRPADKR